MGYHDFENRPKEFAPQNPSVFFLGGHGEGQGL